MKKLLVVLGIVAGIFSRAWAGVNSSICKNYYNGKCYYDSSTAVEYARYHNELINFDFVQHEHRSEFAPYYNSNIFISELLFTGLIGNNNIDEYHKYYNADVEGYRNHHYYAWFYLNDYEDNNPYKSDFSKSYWNSNELYKYAKSNKSTYKGMHFSFITKDTPRAYLDVSKVKIGDIIFIDKTDDGKMDFTLIVTKIDNTKRGYHKILVSYSNCGGGNNNYCGDGTLAYVYNRALSELNALYKYKATFHVFRPTFYSDNGL